ncbi:AzlC family ABC transporter permease [Halomonas sp. V046]|uniref:AzlC family ABC transporter permease n=1 Tax=Halomonas sp. V046 TaxID=3459611 RepID=UPI004043A5AE
MLPLAGFTVAFGLAFGVAAQQQGLEDWQALSMSVLMFAAPSQFAALELWQSPLPLVALMVTTAAIHTRHMVMSAALYPWLHPLPRRQQLALLALVTDSSWAMALGGYRRGERDAGLLLGSGIALWGAWWIGTALGVGFGGGVTQPDRFGLDVIMLCFLLAILWGEGPQYGMLVPWTAAACASLAAYLWLPAYMHVVVGALVGGIVACWRSMLSTTTGRPS